MFVVIKLHNVCNYNCSFCGDTFKDGTQRWKPLSVYKQYIDTIISQSGTKKVWFLLNGGEPTLYPDLIALCKYIKEYKNTYLSIISNGSRTIRWWEELRDSDSLDTLFVTYHSEQTSNYKHIADVINTFHDSPISVICDVTHTPNNLDLSVEACAYLIANTGAEINLRAMQIDGESHYTVPYTNDQISNINKYTCVLGKLSKTKKPSRVPASDKLKSTVNVTFENSKTVRMVAETLRKQELNYFKGWYCEAGINTMRIDYDVIWRAGAGCLVGGPKKIDDNNIPETLTFEKEGVECTADFCSCIIDLVITKYKSKG